MTFKLVLLGTGQKASDTLKKLVSNNLFSVELVIPRTISKQNSCWFDNGILESTCKDLEITSEICVDVNAGYVVEKINNLNIDLIVNVGHGQLFKCELIKSSRLGILNYHPGLLPYGRGSGALVGEIYNGSTLVGRTCHFVDHTFDRGIIVNQETFTVSNDDIMTDVLQRVHLNADSFIEESVVMALSEDNSTRNTLSEFGRYFPKFVAGDDVIDWNQPSLLIYNKIRSRLNERYSRIYTRHDMNEYLVSSAALANNIEDYLSVNGQVIDKSDKGILVKTGDSAIWIRELFDPIKSCFYTPSFKIGTCFQTVNISDFISLHARFQDN